MLEKMMNEIIAKYGFEDPVTIAFCGACEKAGKSIFKIVLVYNKLMGKNESR